MISHSLEARMRGEAALTRFETGLFFVCAFLMASGLMMVGIG
jgi:hypothetical protein